MGVTGKINTARLADIVAPRSVAVVGASEDLGKFGGRALHHLIKHGFQGRIVPINLKRPNLFGLPAAPTIVAAGSKRVLSSLAADEGVGAVGRAEDLAGPAGRAPRGMPKRHRGAQTIGVLGFRPALLHVADHGQRWRRQPYWSGLRRISGNSR